MQKDEATVDAYLRILRQFTQWVAERIQITDQRPVSMLTAPCPIIEADDAERLKWIVGETAKQTQERIWATTQPLLSHP